MFHLIFVVMPKLVWKLNIFWKMIFLDDVLIFISYIHACELPS